MASVSFNGNKITQKLDLLIQVQLPFIASKTVNELAPIARKAVQREMQSEFTYMNALTAESPLYGDASVGKPKMAHYKEARPYVDVYINWKTGRAGQTPADYLKPQIVGGPVLLTRFQKRLTVSRNGPYYLPIHSSPAAQLNETGRIRASQYQDVGQELKLFDYSTNTKRKAGNNKKRKYILIQPSLETRKPRNGRSWFQGYGIYKVTSSDPVLLFRRLNRVPTVRPNFQFRQAVRYSVAQNFQQQFDRAVAYALRKP